MKQQSTCGVCAKTHEHARKVKFPEASMHVCWSRPLTRSRPIGLLHGLPRIFTNNPEISRTRYCHSSSTARSFLPRSRASIFLFPWCANVLRGAATEEFTAVISVTRVKVKPRSYIPWCERQRERKRKEERKRKKEKAKEQEKERERNFLSLFEVDEREKFFWVRLSLFGFVRTLVKLAARAEQR